jgi:hypothetical protein
MASRRGCRLSCRFATNTKAASLSPSRSSVDINRLLTRKRRCRNCLSAFSRMSKRTSVCRRACRAPEVSSSRSIISTRYSTHGQPHAYSIRCGARLSRDCGDPPPSQGPHENIRHGSTARRTSSPVRYRGGAISCALYQFPTDIGGAALGCSCTSLSTSLCGQNAE